MKLLFIFLLLCTFLTSCVTTAVKEEEKADSTAVVVLEPVKKTLWNIPLGTILKDDTPFILAVPNDYGIDLMSEPTPKKTDDLLTDTLQGIILDRSVEPLLNNGCEPMRSIKVELGAEPRSGWVRAEDVYTIRALDVASFMQGDLSLKVGLMDPWYRQDEDNNCVFIHMIFLYDDRYIYLIDATGTDFDLHWEKAQHLSVINNLESLSIKGIQEDGIWLLTWGEPNVKKELRILWTGDHVKYHSYNTIPQNDVDDINPDGDVEVETVGEVQTVTCTLQDAGLGDCYHLEFDCGDFGSAQVELAGAEADLWQELSMDKDDMVVVNPKYKGKSFIITYQIIIGEGCGDPGEDHSRDQIQRVTGFKMKN